MRVIIKDDYTQLCNWSAYYILHRINKHNKTTKRPFVLGLPTGSTPIGLYKRLVKYHRDGLLSFNNIITFNMDEYIGLPTNHNQSYHYFMWKHLFSHIDIPRENINMLDGMATDLDKECNRYEDKIKQVGGIDLFIAGVGTDGHIAFNEPGSSMVSRTRIKTLCRDTIISNSRFFENDPIKVPTTALTVGIGTIMDSSEVVALVSGSSKTHALQQCLEGSINNSWTITTLQNHPKSIIVCDRESTKELKTKTVEYFDDLQRTTNIYGEQNHNNIPKFITNTDKILIFSPHPDDDVIGLGGTLQMLNKSNITIVYMTDGSGGYDKSKYESNPRKHEATLSLKILGYSKKQLRFLNLPFYTNRHVGNKNTCITDSDIEIITDLINDINPKHIFICDDIDPNKTHLTCYNIIYSSLKNNSIQFNSFIWLYNSAWGVWDSNKEIPNCISYLNQKQFNLKKLSIMMHDSQDPPKVNDGDNEPFHIKIEKLNKSKLNPGYYEEQFLVLPMQDYIKNHCKIK